MSDKVRLCAEDCPYIHELIKTNVALLDMVNVLFSIVESEAKNLSPLAAVKVALFGQMVSAEQERVAQVMAEERGNG